MSSRRSSGMPGPLSRTSIRHWPPRLAADREADHRLVGTSAVTRIALRSRLSSAWASSSGSALSFSVVGLDLEPDVDLVARRRWPSPAAGFPPPTAGPGRCGGGRPAPGRTRDSSRRSAKCPRPGAPPSRSRRGRRPVDALGFSAAATMSAPERASEVTGVSEFMISWVSTRTRSAWAAISSAPSSLCTGRIDSTVTAAVQPGDMRRREDGAVRHAVDHQPGDLARARRQLRGGDQLGPERCAGPRRGAR